MLIWLISDQAKTMLTKWFSALMNRAALLKEKKFITKSTFREKRYLGSGGTGRFRDTLWAAALATKALGRKSEEVKKQLAETHRAKVYAELS